LLLGGKLLKPRKEEFNKLVKQGCELIPVYREILADTETPVSAFLKLAGEGPAFLLESVERAEKLGRYSFLGFNPTKVIEESSLECNPLPALEKEVLSKRFASNPSLPPFQGGLVGFLSYDFVRYFERLPGQARVDLPMPLVAFMLVDTFLVFDHFTRKVFLVKVVNAADDGAYEAASQGLVKLIEKLNTNPLLPPRDYELSSFRCLTEDTEFKRQVLKIKEFIRAGDAFQVVLSRRFVGNFKGDTFSVYRVLRSINPSPYMFYLRFPEVTLVGSSPEPLLRIEGDKAITRPIAGTRPRGRTEKEDTKLAQELLGDEKERAEHLMLVDLGRNDLGRVCLPGTVKVTDFMRVEKYSHVMHIVSEVEGKLSSQATPFQALAAVFPAGTVSGAPKVRAMEIIDELEPVERGPYAGAVGYLSFNGDLDSCITIRTLVFSQNQVFIQAGAGIVADSQPERELKETTHKVMALIESLSDPTHQEIKNGVGY
jgi:anthranilate synthase component 1